MREIKFRAWDKVNKAWYKLYATTNALDLRNSNIIFLQYTGLLDKKGVEIYEGDIIEEMMYVAWCDKQCSFEPFMSGYGSNECMACGGDVMWYEIAEDPSRYKVIGNIYENKELLK